MSSLLIYGKNLHEIPTKIFRKQIKNYELNRDSYIESFKIECIGKGKFCGWQLDGNERFIMNNFIVTHNSRLLSGKDAASPRYIYTRLSDITTKIFDKKDSNILSYLEDDGLSIEPEWFLPVIPMVLVNGCEGIGTGYSTYIPPFNPKDIFSNLLRVLDDLEPLPMTPYFKNFNGILESIENGSFITKGKWERTGESQIKITELPVGTAVTTYKEFLESLIEGASDKIKNTTKSKSKPKSIHLKDVKNKTKDENSEICFIIDFKNSHELDDLLKKNELEKLLKLSKTFGTNNMYLFSENLILTKYKNANDILLDFFDIRLEYYEKRKSFLIKRLTNQLTLLNSKVRFINEYIDGSLDINRKSKDYIVKLLEENKYPKLSFNIDTDDTDDTQDKEKSYDYLVKMQLVSLSLEKIKELQNQTDSKQAELGILQSKTHKDLWKDDLHSILKLTHI
jgi:Type IIA topoisomerase (DNA gyrase/topo II, topoisomerase IV), A subunit